eukprot:CCRYP_016258-RA/>CCRYP_016258-RA protein AED:0.02 eAED:0.02 QI:197/1/1/1/1/1/3/1530/391
MTRPLAPGLSSAAFLLSNDDNPAPEKTVAFLRSLTDMLVNNHELISFVPGELCNGQIKTLGRIVVHDRNRIQNEVLPFYFNHASFASLRRQLSYFSFVRLGKERLSGTVTYVNDAVVELSDILRLKRRTVGGASLSGAVSIVKARAMDAKGKIHEQHIQRTGERHMSGERKQDGRDLTQKQSRDVALAVLSGRMHACETNHSLDAKKFRQTSSVAALKSVSAVTLGSKSRAAETSNEVSSKKKRNSVVHKRRRESAPRIDRLLYINTIVPFIHLPDRVFNAMRLDQSMLEGVCRQPISTSAGSRKARCDGKSSRNRNGSNSNDNEDTGYEVRASKARLSVSNSSSREDKRQESTTDASSLTETNFHSACFENDMNSSKSVAIALLALGTNR